MTSELRVTTLSNATGDGPATLTNQSAAKAHQHLEQITNTLRKSLNISSSTDNATGDFTSNFTNSWSDAYYMFSHGADESGYNDAAAYHSKGLTWTTTAFRYRSAYAWNASAGFADFQMATIVWHGDLA